MGPPVPITARMRSTPQARRYTRRSFRSGCVGCRLFKSLGFRDSVVWFQFLVQFCADPWRSDAVTRGAVCSLGF
eukprot:516375-Prorocentrum_minimum.AAC.1